MAFSTGIAGLDGLRELSLFAGCGGGILGGKLLGWRCVCAVEIEAYCREALLWRQRDGLLPLFPIWDDVKTFDGKPWRGRVDIVTGGFPCQPFSTVGKQKGSDDARNMWPETVRCLREVGPRIALLENVPGLLSFDYFGQILGDLAEAGYAAEWDVVSAAEVGAPHLRERLWILAYPACPDAGQSERQSTDRQRQTAPGKRGKLRDESLGRGPHPGDVANAQQDGCVANAAQSNPGTVGSGSHTPCEKGSSQAIATGNCRQVSNSQSQQRRHQSGNPADGIRRGMRDESVSSRQAVSNSSQVRCNAGGTEQPLQGIGQQSQARQETGKSRDTYGKSQEAERTVGSGSDPEPTGDRWSDWWSAQPGLGGASHGLAAWLDGTWESGIPRITEKTANRVQRLKAIGNGQVPQTVRKAFLTLAERAGLLVPDDAGNGHFIG